MIKSLSVIIPLYNGENYIATALESIIGSLNFFYHQYDNSRDVKSEIVVVNDCSTDNGVSVVSQFATGNDYTIKLINHEMNRGQSAARNTGVKNCEGEILFFCDQDDRYLPEHIYLCFMILQGRDRENSYFSIKSSNHSINVNLSEQKVDAVQTGVKIREKIHPYWKEVIENSLPLNLCVRKECHNFIEGFPEDLIYRQTCGGEDTTYRRCLLTFFKMAKINLETVEFLRYPGNSFDKQISKFQLPPEQSKKILLPHENASLLQERYQLERQKINYLKKKYFQGHPNHPSGNSLEMRNLNTAIPPEALSSIHRSHLRYSYRGIRLLKNPFDFALYHLILWNIKPRTIIEVGSFNGGSAIWLGDLLNTFGIDGHIYSIDINKVETLKHENVTFMQGNARQLETVLTSDFINSIPRPLLIIEDADHCYETTIKVLHFFHPYLNKGEYIIVEDGIISDLGIAQEYNGGPRRALQEFLSEYKNEYEIDSKYCDFFGHNYTWCTNGFLKKI